MTVAQAFELAVQHHQAGRLAEAEALYRQILTVQPDYPDALHMLGILASQLDRNDLAVELILKAIALAPFAATFYSNLGEVYRHLGQLESAIAQVINELMA